MIKKLLDGESDIYNLSKEEVNDLLLHISFEVDVNKLSQLKLLIDYELMILNTGIEYLSSIDTKDEIQLFIKQRKRKMYNDIIKFINKRLKYLEFINIQCYIEE